MVDLKDFKCTMLRAKTHSAQVSGRGTVSVFETNPNVAQHACKIHMTKLENFLVELPGGDDVIFIPGSDVAHARFKRLTMTEKLAQEPEPKILEVAKAHERDAVQVSAGGPLTREHIEKATQRAKDVTSGAIKATKQPTA